MKESHRYGDYNGNLMEPYPPTLEVRFGKDKIKDLVRDKYELNAYLLGTIFSVTKDPGNSDNLKNAELSYSDDSSDSNSESSLSLFNSTENNDEKEEEVSQKSSSTTNLKDQKFSTPLPRYPESGTVNIFSLILYLGISFATLSTCNENRNHSKCFSADFRKC